MADHAERGNERRQHAMHRGKINCGHRRKLRAQSQPPSSAHRNLGRRRKRRIRMVMDLVFLPVIAATAVIDARL